jgi:photosystem II stability/assembly factor-like uncharacterized protein
MARLLRFFSVVLVLVLAALACAAPQGMPSATPPPPTTVAPPTIEPTVEIAPTHTPLPTLPVGEAISHLAPGTPVTITSIHMLDASRGWALGGTEARGDHVLRTADAGLTWTDVTPPEPGDSPRAANAFFLDAQTAWVVYGLEAGTPPSQVVVWRTGSGGASWEASQALDLSGLEESFFPLYLTFSDARHGWLMVGVGAGMSHQYVVLYRSEDGGGIWTRLLDPYTDGGIQSLGKTGMVFVDTQHGWLTRDNLGVMEGAFFDMTADGGATWETVMLPAPPDRPDLFQMAECATHSARLTSPQSGTLAVECSLYASDPPGHSAHLYRTRDGGATWTIQPYPGGEVLFLSDSVGYALTRDIYRTDDGGATWTRVKTVSWDGQFSFIDDQRGWAVATSEEGTSLVDTADGAVTWRLIEPVAGE